MGRRPTLVECFSEVEDPRVERTRLHSLVSILVIALCATICGADHFTEMEEYGKAKEAWLKTWLDLPHGIPSHDTFARMFARLDPESIRTCFLRWVEALRQGPLTDGVIALDGKTLRRSFDTATGKSALHMVSAWASSARLVIGQVKTEEKSNEITAIPYLLDLLDVAGCVVTVDAMGCQKAIARKVRQKEADYVLQIKSNQTYLYDDVKAYFQDAVDRGFQNRPVFTHVSRDYEHGRTEVRRCYVSPEVEWLTGRDTDGDWEGLASLVMLQTERTTKGRTTYQRRFYITSLSENARRITEAVRAHWSIENQLHWCLDVSFSEDQCRVRKDHAPENLAVLRQLALNLLKQETTAKMGLNAKRLKAGWDPDYLPKVLTG